MEFEPRIQCNEKRKKEERSSDSAQQIRAREFLLNERTARERREFSAVDSRDSAVINPLG